MVVRRAAHLLAATTIAFSRFLTYAFAGGYTSSATVIDVQTIGGVVRPTFVQSASNNKDNAFVGSFTLGLGVDVALLSNVFLRGEWEFVGFAKVNGILSNTNTGRIGLGVKFQPPLPRLRPFIDIAAVDRRVRLAYLRQWDTPPQRGAPIWKDRP